MGSSCPWRKWLTDERETGGPPVLTLVDRMLQVILLDNVKGLSSGAGAVTADQVFFEPPDGNAFTGAARRLSVYLADIRENVKLRSHERTERVVN